MIQKNITHVSNKINYVLGIWLKTDYPAEHYQNFMNIFNPEEIYEYTLKMMKYLIYS